MILGKVVFVHIPRCSGTSIESSLLNGKLVPDGEKHWSSTMLKAHLGLLWHSAFKFSIVRNPFDRMASLYVTPEAPFSTYNQHAGATMTEFLQLYHPMPWEYGIQCSDYLEENMNMIIKYENRKAGIEMVNQQLTKYGMGKIDDSVVKRNHPDKNPDFMSYYDDYSESLIRAMFAEDFDRWYND